MGWKLPTLVAVLWAVALGTWATVAAGPIGGPWGALAGSVLTVLAGVVTAYIPSLRDEARRRAAERVQAEKDAAAAQTVWDAAGEPMAAVTRQGPQGGCGRTAQL